MRQVLFESLTVDRYGVVVDRNAASAEIVTETLPGGIPLDLVVIPSGEYQMGTQAGQGFDDEHPQHAVTVRGFLISRYLVTQAQWQAVMDWSPPFRNVGPDVPVDRVSFHDAVDLCRQLDRATGRPFRLPTEAEWEYACRAGTSGDFSVGPTLTTDIANYVGKHRYRDEPEGVYRHCSNRGGEYPPNQFGVYDMHGNLWEWCSDVWHDDYVGSPVDGGSWEDGEPASHRVLRGGSWHDPPQNCRSATRLRFLATDAEDTVGIRVAASWERK